MVKARIFLKLAGALIITGFCSAAQAQIVVNLKVNDSQSKLEFTTRGSCSRAPNSNGCVGVSGKVQINLTLSANAQCSSGKWKLDHVALGNSEGSTGNISATAASDFNANQSTGIVTPVSKSDNHILIRDNNTAAYDVWYTVYATCGGSTINSDPRFENDGTGR